MPFSLPSNLAGLGVPFLQGLKSFLDGLETAVQAAQSRADAGYALAQTKSTKPAQGWDWNDLSPQLRATLVTTGSTRPAGTGMHIWPDPTTDPGTAAQYPDRWAGDIA